MKFSFEIGPFSGDIHAIVFFSSFWVIVIFCLCLCLSFAYPNRCYVDLYDTHTHMCQRKFSWKTSKLRTLKKNGGECERKGTERKSNRKQESRKLGYHFSVAGVVTAAHLLIHHIIASYRTTSLHHNHITSHHITSNNSP